MQTSSFLLYGANGYTGELIARFAKDYSLKPILAGRNKQAIEQLASKLKLPFRVFDLSDQSALHAALREVSVVVHAAGPYDDTAVPMVTACMQTNTHYIDLNGDADVFEMLQQYDETARSKNLMILPGAGFDVVPTDCLAMWLKNRLPDANHLTIAFAIIGSGLSRGTSITTLQKLGMAGTIRKDGELISEPMGKRGMWINFKNTPPHRAFVMSIPWGDISTAYFSTGIPNIETYTGVNKTVWLLLKAQGAFNWMLRTKPVRNLILSIIKKRSPGPGDKVRNKAISLVWGRVTNLHGQTLSANLRCPEAYSLTASAVLLITKKITAGKFKPGYQTPASAYGEGLVLEIPGVELLP